MGSEKLKIIHDKEDLYFYYKTNSLKGEINYELKGNNIIDIYRTFVDPDLRGKGIAKALMILEIIIITLIL